MVAIAAIAFSSCDKWMDINTDPNYPSEIPTAMPITSGMGSSATVIGGQYAILGSLWAQHFTQDNTANQYKAWDAYNVTSSVMNSEYLKLYAYSLTDFKKAIKRSAEVEDWNNYLIATVMEAYVFRYWQICMVLFLILKHVRQMKGLPRLNLIPVRRYILICLPD